MAIQHRNIPDAERHEPKGASTATAGQVLSADGAGAATFVNPNTLNNITISSTLQASSVAAQSPVGTDTPLQVEFGALTSNSDVSVASTGVITILTAGVFSLTFDLNIGRTGTTGVATLLTRLLVNDVATGFTNAVKIDTSANLASLETQIMRAFSANDTIKLQIIRDSGGNNDGGLIAVDPVLAGWATSPSAAVRIQKITGAS